MTHLDKAIQYVRDNASWSKAEEQIALDLIGRHYNLPSSISTEIYDLMEEYGVGNDLPEGWWLELIDEDEVFINL